MYQCVSMCHCLLGLTARILRTFWTIRMCVENSEICFNSWVSTHGREGSDPLLVENTVGVRCLSYIFAQILSTLLVPELLQGDKCENWENRVKTFPQKEKLKNFLLLLSVEYQQEKWKQFYEECVEDRHSPLSSAKILPIIRVPGVKLTLVSIPISLLQLLLRNGRYVESKTVTLRAMNVLCRS